MIIEKQSSSSYTEPAWDPLSGSSSVDPPDLWLQTATSHAALEMDLLTRQFQALIDQAHSPEIPEYFELPIPSRRVKARVRRRIKAPFYLVTEQGDLE